MSFKKVSLEKSTSTTLKNSADFQKSSKMADEEPPNPEKISSLETSLIN
ncbi:hypothetical protein KAT80_03765 [Candidatus Pacearchaeota archaeon]|nr:hypothetical protein [Candidatus Pacearchaeota archaeon]